MTSWGFHCFHRYVFAECKLDARFYRISRLFFMLSVYDSSTYINISTLPSPLDGQKGNEKVHLPLSDSSGSKEFGGAARLTYFFAAFIRSQNFEFTDKIHLLTSSSTQTGSDRAAVVRKRARSLVGRGHPADCSRCRCFLRGSVCTVISWVSGC